MKLFFGLLHIGSCFSRGGNRLTYLDAFSDMYYPSLDFPKLTTAQWIGEPGVDAVVVLSFDDLGKMPNNLSNFSSLAFEEFLRPVMESLKEIDGRAPISIMANQVMHGTESQHLQKWIEEGVSIETHGLGHRRPLLQGSFCESVDTYYGCLDQVSRITKKQPVAFRFPTADSRTVVTPRFFSEVAVHSSPQGNVLTIDSSVFNLVTSADSSLPQNLSTDADGRPRFVPYTRVQKKPYHNTIVNYPYPYVINPGMWEVPCSIPSDFMASEMRGNSAPETLQDAKRSLDASVLKRGVFVTAFHPAGWILSEQVSELARYAVETHGSKVKFLNFAELASRIQKHLLLDQPLRTQSGHDNGVRLLDLNDDGFLDVLIGNDVVNKSRLWSPARNLWQETALPMDLRGSRTRFGILHSKVIALQLTASLKQGWTWSEGEWLEDTRLVVGLQHVVAMSDAGRDAGLRLRDVDGDGDCELLVANESFQQIFRFSKEEGCWVPSSVIWPQQAWIVDAQGQDAGFRLVDLNEDGFDDVLFSNAQFYSLALWNKVKGDGWSSTVVARAREESEFPMVVRTGGSNNGVWFHDGFLCIQNEDVEYHWCSYREVLSLACVVKPIAGSPNCSNPADSVVEGSYIPGFTTLLTTLQSRIPAGMAVSPMLLVIPVFAFLIFLWLQARLSKGNAGPVLLS